MTAVVTTQGFSVPEAGARTWGADFSDSLRARGGFDGQSTTWMMASIGRDLIVVSEQTITLGTQPPPAHAVAAAALTAAVAAFRQSALSPAEACPEFDTATVRLGQEIARYSGNWYSSAQLADFRAYGAAVTELGELVGRSGSDTALVRNLELTGAASDVVGMAPKPDAQELTAFTEVTKLYPLVRQACIAIGFWPK